MFRHPFIATRSFAARFLSSSPVPLTAVVLAWSAAGLAQAQQQPQPGTPQDGQRRQFQDQREGQRPPGQPGQSGQGGPGGRGGGFFGGQGGPGGGPGGGGGGMPGFGDMLRPDFSRRDLPLIVGQLKLDDMQRFVLETLVEDYNTEFEQGAKEIRTKMAEVGASWMQGRNGGQRQDRAANEQRDQQMRQRFQELRDQMEKLRAQGGQQADPEELRRMFRERAQALRAEFGDAAPGRPQPGDIRPAIDALSGPIDQWRTKKSQLRQQFMGDLQTQLTEDQTAQWPAFERTLRREKTLGDGVLSGESLNLHTVIHDLTTNRKPSDAAAAPLQAEFEHALKVSTTALDQQTITQATDPILAEYDLALDAALAARNELIERSQRELFDAIRTADSDKAVSVLQRQITMRVAVRDVNLRYVDTIAEALPAGAAPTFRTLVNERAFNRVVRPTQSQRLITSAIKIEGIDDATRGTLQALLDRYTQEINAANERLIQIVRTDEPAQAVQRAQRMTAWLTGVEPKEQPDPIREAYEKRNEIGQRYLQQLQGILPKDQYETLTRDGRNNDRPGQRREDGGQPQGENGNRQRDRGERGGRNRQGGPDQPPPPPIN